MSLLTRLNPRKREYEEEHAAVERRLALQELKARRFEVRLKRLELELGVVVPEIIEQEIK